MGSLRPTRQIAETEDLGQLDALRLAAICRAWLQCHSDVVVVLSQHDRVVHFAGGSSALAGPSGASWPSLWPKDHRRDVRRALAEAKSGGTGRFQAPFPFGSADTRWWDVFVAPVANGAAGAPELLVLLRDITAFKAEVDRKSQSQRLEAVGRLAGGVAHDFNNLLTVIMSATESLAEDLPLEADRQLARVSLEAAQRGADLIRRLMTFSARPAPEEATADCTAAIEAVSRLLARTLPEQIAFHTPPHLPLLYGKVDRAELESVLLNLCINARDAMPAGGRLDLTAEHRDLGAADARRVGAAPGRYAVITVADTGIGMSPEVAERAIEPFFSTKRDAGGTGLGLSLAHSFAMSTRGALQIDSQLGRGTTIRLYIPCAKQARQPQLQLLVSAQAHGVRDILLVEDDIAVRVQACRLLEALGCRVTSAGDAKAAIQILAAGTPVDLMLTDLRLPFGLNGEELAAAAGALRPGLKVLFMSGYLEEFRERRADAVLAKPFIRAQLAAAIAQAASPAQVPTPSIHAS